MWCEFCSEFGWENRLSRPHLEIVYEVLVRGEKCVSILIIIRPIDTTRTAELTYATFHMLMDPILYESQRTLP
jgi:hypothetical protein